MKGTCEGLRTLLCRGCSCMPPGAEFACPHCFGVLRGARRPHNPVPRTALWPRCLQGTPAAVGQALSAPPITSCLVCAHSISPCVWLVHSLRLSKAPVHSLDGAGSRVAPVLLRSFALAATGVGAVPAIPVRCVSLCSILGAYALLQGTHCSKAGRSTSVFNMPMLPWRPSLGGVGS